MNNRKTCNIALPVCVGFIACFVGWLVMGDSSPFARYFLYHVAVRNIWAVLNVIPLLTLEIARPIILGEELRYIGVFAQWWVIGYLLSKLLCGHKESGTSTNVE